MDQFILDRYTSSNVSVPSALTRSAQLTEHADDNSRDDDLAGGLAGEGMPKRVRHRDELKYERDCSPQQRLRVDLGPSVPSPQQRTHDASALVLERHVAVGLRHSQQAITEGVR